MAAEQDSNFQVFVRIKPFEVTVSPTENELSSSIEESSLTGSIKGSLVSNARSITSNSSSAKYSNRKAYDAVKHDGQTIQLIDRDFRYIDSRERFFQFNAIFGPKSTNEEIFTTAVAPKLSGVLEGINTTIMAYGITGAGKTHTIFGESAQYYKQKGVCTYTIEHLLAKIKEVEDSKRTDVYFSYLEIYNEQVIDLLNENSKVLQVLDDAQNGIEFLINGKD